MAKARLTSNIEDLGESTWHHTLTLRAATTKGHKPAVIALAPRTVQAISLSVAERRSGPLLRNIHGRRMTPYNVAYLVTDLCRATGVERRIMPHSLRHSAITIALDAGVRLRDVQDFARHEDPRPPVATTGPAASSTATPPMRSPSTSPAATEETVHPQARSRLAGDARPTSRQHVR